ncbi:unnamed protein product [Pleuronectes platessa]|uniref:Myosin tail domain-containing protein n=1 Tax=Pleuronectes platessa TaxID=8262 RepID=A0A9N7VNB7_PLEPL|nr:unnamed protein product [Pleuronectes platessa]
MRKKHSDALAELGEQLENLTSLRVKLEKDKQIMKATQKAKAQLENNDVSRELEDVQSKLMQSTRLKASLTLQQYELKQQVDEENKGRYTAVVALANARHDLSLLKEQLEEESDARREMQLLVRKLAVRLQEAEEAAGAAQARAASLEKVKQRLPGEMEDHTIDLEKSNAAAAALDKKQQLFDKLAAERSQKNEELQLELDSSQKESRSYTTELYKLKTAYEESQDLIDNIHKENKILSEEIKDLVDQLGEGGRSVHELQEAKKELEVEREEMKLAMEEAEASLEVQEALTAKKPKCLSIDTAGEEEEEEEEEEEVEKEAVTQQLHRAAD